MEYGVVGGRTFHDWLKKGCLVGERLGTTALDALQLSLSV